MSDLAASMRLGAPYGSAISALLVLGLLVLAVLGVRQALALQVPRRRWTLAGMRALTALGTALFVLQPQWISERMQEVQGRLAVLLDVSRSMSVRDGGKTRAERSAELVKRLYASKPAPELYAFGANARPLRAAELDGQDLASEDDTRIERALQHVTSSMGDELGAIVLVSDGADLTPGWSPERLARLGVRVHTVAVAQDRDAADDAITAVQADAVAFLRQDAQVEVSVRSTRAGASPLTVSLRHEGEIVSETEVALDERGLGKAVLPFTVTRTGRAVYSVSLPLSDGDAVPENNERAFLMRVSRDKLRVLLLCGAPTWDTRFLRAFLKADPAIDLITFFILRTNNDLTMASADELSLIPFPTDELFREHLESFDLVIFQDFNYGPYQVGGYLPRIRDYVVAGGAFAMVGGIRSFGPGGYDGTPIAEVLPVDMAPGAAAISEAPFQPVLAPELARHPVVELVPDPIENARAWAELAPLAGANQLLAARPGASVLLTHPSERNGQGGPMPVLAVGSAGKGRVLALGSDSTWRYSITTAGVRGDASAYDRFWDRALRWLSRDPTLEPAQIETDRERYGPGGHIDARLRLRDERYQPLGERNFELRVLDEGSRIKSSQSVGSDAAGNAKATLSAPRAPGAYRLAVVDETRGVLAEQGFLVEAAGDELADPQPRPELLRAIADVTRGKYFTDPADVQLDALDRTRARSLGTDVRAPFSSAWFFAFLLLAFAAEWALRRAWGLR
jgi:uncharacterized membrane protein